jgi:hypothetical protein
MGGEKHANLQTDAGKRPLIFGVSGHRDPLPAAVPELRGQLQSVFSRFRAAYPDTPFELLSPLAEGADRLVAEVALSYQIKLRVPMPLAQKEYERDFPSATSVSEFRRMLAAAESCWEVPGNGDPSGPAGDGGSAQSRAERYAAMGDFIARRSDVLLLLWDGRENNKKGGTAWVKKRREYWVGTAAERPDEADPSRYGRTIQIVTPRATSDAGSESRPRVEIIGDLPPG